jgi:anti-sigma regulatory factor (Ser/Thr protein kinase)
VPGSVRRSVEHVLELPTAPDAVPAARALLRRVVGGPAGGAVAHRLEDGELALSELVTNAVLHGREPLSVRLVVRPDLVHVEVCDANPVSPSFSMLDETALTGRGLLLISAVADRWGVEPSAAGKVVWFELLAHRDLQTVLDVDALLASWADELAVDPADECVRVVLTDLDVALVARSEAHVEGLVRELTLVLAADSAPAADRRPAGNVVSAAAAVDPVRADLRHQVAVALSRGQALVDVELTVRRRDAEAVRDLLHALDEADRLSRAGRLLLAPAPQELSDARRGYLRRVLAQLGS